MGSDTEFWDEAVTWVKHLVESEEFDEWERNYKIKNGQRLGAVRDTFLEGGEFLPQLKSVLLTRPSIPSWQEVDRLVKAIQASPDMSNQALHILWDPDRPVSERLQGFVSTLPTSHYPSTNLISALHMAMDTTQYPPYKPTAFKKAAQILKSDLPDRNVRTEQHLIYQDALNLLDKVMSESAARGVILRDRLDAQGVVYTLGNKEGGFPSWGEPTQRAYKQFVGAKSADTVSTTTDSGSESEPVQSSDNVPNATQPAVATKLSKIIDEIQARGIRLDPRTIRRYHLALGSRGFVILAGVSGTGKTWLAEAYATIVGARFLRVAVAPNWTANEDLIGYFNPVIGSYHHTPTSLFIREAASEYVSHGSAAGDYHLLLDEMNLARIEHYFATFLSAMEEMHRHGSARIPIPGEEPLVLTPNLKLVGTVNIDETTHGFADKVFDRAQLIELRAHETTIRAHLGDRPWSDTLLDIWLALETAAPFAFRVIDDINRYVELASRDDVGWQQALDEQIEQKILPKLSGNRTALPDALANLHPLLVDDFPLSAQRVETMTKQQHELGFVSFFS